MRHLLNSILILKLGKWHWDGEFFNHNAASTLRFWLLSLQGLVIEVFFPEIRKMFQRSKFMESREHPVKWLFGLYCGLMCSSFTVWKMGGNPRLEDRLSHRTVSHGVFGRSEEFCNTEGRKKNGNGYFQKNKNNDLCLKIKMTVPDTHVTAV